MFKNHDSGLSNTYTGSLRPGIHGELPHCSEGQTKKIQTLRTAVSGSHKGEKTCLSELLLVSETFDYFFFDYFSENGLRSLHFLSMTDVKLIRLGNNGWKIHTTKDRKS